ncbi:MAG TPA: flagellar basal body P-ring formation chaperone FlgA, partial [Longimicrobiaceae bacterium]|nr:flagellar basal body P-ring formation chaperone FlgA [Longimicrobiaceae bacterium]
MRTRGIPAIVALLALVCGAGAAHAQAAAAVPVAARDLARGTVLAPADIAMHDDADAPSAVLGWVTRRVVSAGEPLRSPAVAPPHVIRSGDTVQLVWRDGAMEIRMRGRAMGSAAAGEKVLVRVDTQRRFEGIAHAPGEVRLAPP